MPAVGPTFISHLRSSWTWLALAGILAAHLWVNAVWLGADNTLRAEDQSTQLASAASAYQLVTGQGMEGVWGVLRSKVGPEQPGAGYLVWVALTGVFGQSIFSLRLLNIFYLALLLVCVKVVGQRLHSARAGLLAAALLSLYPGIFGASRQFGADFPATALVAAGVAALLWCDRFGRSGPSALLGLTVGLGMLVRPLTLFSLAPVLALAAAWSLFRPPAVSRLRLLLNLSLAAAVAVWVSALWWWGRVPAIVEALTVHQVGEVRMHWMEQSSLVYYLQHLPHGTTPFLLGVAGLALAGLLLGRRQLRLSSRPEPWLVWAWLVFGLGALALLKVHMLRYSFPALPALALVTAHGLCLLPHRMSRRLMVATVIVTAAASWLLCSFAVGPPARAAAGSEEVCSTYLCGSWRYGGPPSTDPLLQRAQDVAQVLRRAHGDGARVVVRVPLDLRGDSKDFEILHAFAAANAVLMTRLPRVVVSGRAWAAASKPDRSDDGMHDLFCGLSTARAGPYAHCYTLVIRQTDRAAPAVTGTRLLVKTAPYGGETLRYTLWRHQPCPVPYRAP